jgi:hypothetical protein
MALVITLDKTYIYNTIKWYFDNRDKVFQQFTGIPMDTNCAPLLADLSLYTYKVEFIQKLLQKKKTLEVTFNPTF